MCGLRPARRRGNIRVTSANVINCSLPISIPTILLPQPDIQIEHRQANDDEFVGPWEKAWKLRGRPWEHMDERKNTRMRVEEKHRYGSYGESVELPRILARIRKRRRGYANVAFTT